MQKISCDFFSPLQFINNHNIKYYFFVYLQHVGPVHLFLLLLATEIRNKSKRDLYLKRALLKITQLIFERERRNKRFSSYQGKCFNNENKTSGGKVETPQMLFGVGYNNGENKPFHFLLHLTLHKHFLYTHNSEAYFIFLKL